jgi:hypothetical protein
MEKESEERLKVSNDGSSPSTNSNTSKKKQQPKFSFDGHDYRDDSNLKAYLKKERKGKEVIVTREKRTEGTQKN